MAQEEKFKEAQRLYETANADQRYVLESLFPELRESEDERIRKELIKVFTNRKELVKDQSFGDIIISDILAWLEKQGEHANFLSKIQVGDKVTRNKDGVLVNLSQLNRVAKPAEKRWSEEDETKIKSIIALLKNPAVCSMDGNKGIIDASIKYLKDLKDRVKPQLKQEWSEEDERMCQETIDWFEKKCFPYALEHENPARESIRWLKSLRPQSQWKPSEMQIEALEWQVNNTSEGSWQYEESKNLLKQIKKLREE